jgi:molybdenum cofactor biosynthesis protein B
MEPDMQGIDERRTETDRSGGLLVERRTEAGRRRVEKAIVTDEVEPVRARVRIRDADPAIDIVITTGGTCVCA